MSFQKGGQRRTIQTNCGWICVGHPTEVNKKFLIHKRYCKDCSNNISVLPEYNREEGLINGWKGLNGNLEQTNKIMTTVFVNGVRKDILVEGVSNIEDSMKDVKLLLSLTEEEIKELQETPVLTKSKQKRQKQKAKKEREKKAELTEDETLRALFIISNNLTKDMALYTMKTLHPHIYDVVNKDWDKYYNLYLKSDKDWDKLKRI